MTTTRRHSKYDPTAPGVISIRYTRNGADNLARRLQAETGATFTVTKQREGEWWVLRGRARTRKPIETRTNLVRVGELVTIRFKGGGGVTGKVVATGPTALGVNAGVMGTQRIPYETISNITRHRTGQARNKRRRRPVGSMIRRHKRTR